MALLGERAKLVEGCRKVSTLVGFNAGLTVRCAKSYRVVETRSWAWFMWLQNPRPRLYSPAGLVRCQAENIFQLFAPTAVRAGFEGTPAVAAVSCCGTCSALGVHQQGNFQPVLAAQVLQQGLAAARVVAQLAAILGRRVRAGSYEVSRPLLG